MLRTGRYRWLARLALRPALAALYLGAWGLMGLLNVGPTDLDAFFWPAARIALAGDPLGVYRVRFGVLGPFGMPGFPLQGYPDANGPLSLAPLTAVAWLAARLGWLDDFTLRRALALAVFAAFALLLSREALLIVEDALGQRLRGGWRLAALALFALSPELLRSMLLYGHIEQPILLWLILAATRTLRQSAGARQGVAPWAAARAGALLGLALLTRSTALLALTPLALMLLRHPSLDVGKRRPQWRPAVIFVAMAGLVAALGLAPFWWADRADLTYSLVTAHTLIPVGGGTFWGLWVLAHGQSLGLAISALGMRDDTWVVVGLATLLSVVALLTRRDLTIRSREVYALLALCSLCFPLFDKTLWPYYFLEPYTFVALWWLLGLPQIAGVARQMPDEQTEARNTTPAKTPIARPTETQADAMARWRLGAALPAGVVLAAALDEYLLGMEGAGPWPLLWTALMFGGMLGVTLALGHAVWGWTARTQPTRGPVQRE